MQHLIKFLEKRLQEELPHHDIKNEDISEKLRKLVVLAETKAREMMAERPPRICAVMIALYKNDDQLYVPMMLRPSNSRVHPSQVAFPGGKQEEADKDLIETAIREMEEEVGVTVPRSQILGALSPVYIPPSNALVTPIVGYLNEKPTYTPEPAEVEEVLDVTIEDLRNPANITIKKAVISKDDYINMPAYKANGKIIWGGTARMIAEFNKLLDEFDKRLV